jgi:hypothetical protein
LLLSNVVESWRLWSPGSSLLACRAPGASDWSPHRPPRTEKGDPMPRRAGSRLAELHERSEAPANSSLQSGSLSAMTGAVSSSTLTDFHLHPSASGRGTSPPRIDFRLYPTQASSHGGLFSAPAPTTCTRPASKIGSAGLAWEEPLRTDAPVPWTEHFTSRSLNVGLESRSSAPCFGPREREASDAVADSLRSCVRALHENDEGLDSNRGCRSAVDGSSGTGSQPQQVSESIAWPKRRETANPSQPRLPLKPTPVILHAGQPVAALKRIQQARPRPGQTHEPRAETRTGISAFTAVASRRAAVSVSRYHGHECRELQLLAAAAVGVGGVRRSSGGLPGDDG